jgi:hypothetical protein
MNWIIYLDHSQNRILIRRFVGEVENTGNILGIAVNMFEPLFKEGVIIKE